MKTINKVIYNTEQNIEDAVRFYICDLIECANSENKTPPDSVINTVGNAVHSAIRSAVREDTKYKINAFNC